MAAKLWMENLYLSILIKPAAYILHKLVINKERKPEYKQEKDAQLLRNDFMFMVS